MRRFIRFTAVLCTAVFLLISGIIIYAANKFPDTIMTVNNEIEFGSYFIIKPDTAYSKENPKNVSAEIKLLNTIPVKSVFLNKTERRYVIPGGELIGIRLNTEGVLIVGTECFYSNGSEVNPAENAGLRAGDIIITVNGREIQSNKELTDIIRENGKKKIEIKAKRDNNTMTVLLQPEISDLTGTYKAGIWVRDCSSGIGTLTYIDKENGTFATLGHGIYDCDTGKLLTSCSGDIMYAALNGITKGKKGRAGEVRGMIGKIKIGELKNNNDEGVYGILTENVSSSEEIPVAFSSELKTGKAEIICSVINGEKERFEIEIEKINYNSMNTDKNMIIRITDQKLTDHTGGIIQGMSGSPIIQDGKLVGAVTHVFLNDPLKGYGIFAEKMIVNSDVYSCNNAA